jgi:rhamnosyltransferase
VAGESKVTLQATKPEGKLAVKISVVIRTYTRDEAEVGRLLTTLAEQTMQPWECVVIDSGSAPPVQHQLRRFQCSGIETSAGRSIPLRLLEIPNQAYQSARALNGAIEAAQGELMAIISQDALPADAHYLERLAAAFDNALVAGAYGRQMIPVAGYPLWEKDLAKTYPPQSRLQRQPDCWFVNACSMIRRDLWQQHAFDEQAMISEDHEWAKWFQGQGYVIQYEAAAIVYHYHDERLGDIWRRFFAEGQGLAYIHRRRMSLWQTCWRGMREMASDGLWLMRRCMVWYWPIALVRRTVKYAGLYWGHRIGDIMRPRGSIQQRESSLERSSQT